MRDSVVFVLIRAEDVLYPGLAQPFTTSTQGEMQPKNGDWHILHSLRPLACAEGAVVALGLLTAAASSLYSRCLQVENCFDGLGGLTLSSPPKPPSQPPPMTQHMAQPAPSPPTVQLLGKQRKELLCFVLRWLSGIQGRVKAAVFERGLFRTQPLLASPVGKSQIFLVSPDTKKVAIEKSFREISFCSQGIRHVDHFGFICRESLENGSCQYVCYVFQCTDEALVSGRAERRDAGAGG
ncbi:hypothetical protein JZ751_016452 [Albula glossodonta]|uniref:PID domain-containing protein n=1 Tax=Albula glossodonta TaxID=121402 RepID=A0A8T2NTD9_9TELE|nr:hypothetical protein JZ751_016452 [Albula glossodonta]